jgi:hypothetical protein
MLITILQSDYLYGIGLALFGGFVRIFVQHDGNVKARSVFVGLLAAAFVGAVFTAIVQYYGLRTKLIGIVSLLGGYLYKETINLLTTKFLARLRNGNGKF